MAQYANYHRDVKKCPDGYPAIDFMNFVERKEDAKAKLTDEEIQAQIDSEVFGM